MCAERFQLSTRIDQDGHFAIKCCACGKVHRVRHEQSNGKVTFNLSNLQIKEEVEILQNLALAYDESDFSVLDKHELNTYIKLGKQASELLRGQDKESE